MLQLRHVPAACRCLLIFIAIAASSGCYSGKAYEGKARPESDIAIIFGRNPLFGPAMLVHQLDNQAPFYPSLARVEVLPGKHTVYIMYMSHSSLPPNEIRALPVVAVLETEAGHKYQINGEGDLFETDMPRVWIVDTGSGKTVWEQKR